MGIKDLWKLVYPTGHTSTLSKLAFDATKIKQNDPSRTIEDVPVIGIDMGTYFDECVAVTISSGMHIASSSGPFRPFFYRLCKLLEVPAAFVFVFDGPERPAMKRNAQVQRHQPMWWAEPAKELIKQFGYHYHQAPGEAEAELSQLNRWGALDAILTRDSDAFVFGATCVATSLKSNNKKGSNDIRRYDASEISTNLHLPPSRLFFYALAAGGDYSPGLKNCGNVHATALARSGIGDSLYSQTRSARGEIERKCAIEGWRAETLEKLDTDPAFCPPRFRRSFRAQLPQFPSPDVVANYISPATSSTSIEYAPNTREWRSIDRPNVRAIVKFCRDRLAWSDTQTLLKTLRNNFWGGLVLRMVFSEQCRWDSQAETFGISAYQLPIHSCHVKSRQAGGNIHGQAQARLIVREVDILDLFLDGGGFLSAKTELEEVRVWVPLEMVPGWALGVGASPKRKHRSDGGKTGSKRARNSRGSALAPANFDPTGDVLRDLQQLEELQEMNDSDSAGEGSGSSADLGIVDLTSDIEPQNEGPSKRRRLSGTGETIDLTD